MAMAMAMAMVVKMVLRTMKTAATKSVLLLGRADPLMLCVNEEERTDEIEKKERERDNNRNNNNNITGDK